MRLSDFEALVRRVAGEVPSEFLQGVAEIAVSPRVVPHPERAGIYTLGECIPLPTTDSDSTEGIQSRIVLYHGSFVALAGLHPGFDWREEAWETLTHELRHHLEWRARAPALEAFDHAVERGRSYRIDLPAGVTLPAFLTLDGIAEPPPGDLVLVLRRKPGLRDLLRSRPPTQATVHAVELYFSPDPADSSNA
jgi:hypothetical protein